MNDDILEATKEFAVWQKKKRGRGGIVPEIFINKFKLLYKKYKNYELYKTLGISKYSWDKKVLELSKKPPKSSNSFVLLPTPDVNNVEEENKQKSPNNPSPAMKFKFPNGIEITIFS